LTKDPDHYDEPSKARRVPKYTVKEETTRSRSKQQESRLAKIYKGRTTINSGATFGENDVVTDILEVEAKTTAKMSFSINAKDLKKLMDKSPAGKIPVFEVCFEKLGKSFTIIQQEDFRQLIQIINESNH